MSKNESVNEFKELAESLKERFAILPAGNFVDCETGEYLSKDEVDKIQENIIEDYKVNLFGDINAISANVLELENKQRLINKKSKTQKKDDKLKVQYKSGFEFNKVFRDMISKENYMELDKHEKLVYFVLRDFVTNPDNCVMIDGLIPTIDEMRKIVGLSKTVFINSLKSLEEKGLIIRKFENVRRKLIYYHPDYYTGGWISDSTLEIFGLERVKEDKDKQ